MLAKIIRRKVSSGQGFTLIEIMISLAIFVIVLPISTYVLMAAQQLSEENRGKLIAMNVARSIMETVKYKTLTDIPNISAGSFIPSNLPNGAATIQTSSATNDLSVDPIATVTVNVSWRGPRGRTKNLQITSKRSRY